MIWHYCRGSDTRKVERVQERALQAIYCFNVLIRFGNYLKIQQCSAREFATGSPNYGDPLIFT
jgi:hypothetical protein